MLMCRVWNDNILPFKQNFEEEQLVIKANAFIIMDEEKAHKLLSAWAPMTFDAGGNQKVESFKKLRIEVLEGEFAKPVPVKPIISPLKCLACGYDGKDKKDYNDHVNANHLSQMVDEDAKEKIKSAR